MARALHDATRRQHRGDDRPKLVRRRDGRLFGRDRFCHAQLDRLGQPGQTLPQLLDLAVFGPEFPVAFEPASNVTELRGRDRVGLGQSVVVLLAQARELTEPVFVPAAPPDECSRAQQQGADEGQQDKPLLVIGRDAAGRRRHSPAGGRFDFGGIGRHRPGANGRRQGDAESGVAGRHGEIAPVAAGRAAVAGLAVPGPAAADLRRAGGRAGRISRGVAGIFSVGVEAPFPDVAEHVVQTPRIWLARPHGARPGIPLRILLVGPVLGVPAAAMEAHAAVAAIPGDGIEHGRVVFAADIQRAGIGRGLLPCPAGIFPLGLGRQRILVTLGQPAGRLFEGGEFFSETDRVLPRDEIHRQKILLPPQPAARIGILGAAPAIAQGLILAAQPVKPVILQGAPDQVAHRGLHDRAPLAVGHRRAAEPEAARNRHRGARPFLIIAARFALGTAHRELPGLDPDQRKRSPRRQLDAPGRVRRRHRRIGSLIPGHLRRHRRVARRHVDDRGQADAKTEGVAPGARSVLSAAGHPAIAGLGVPAPAAHDAHAAHEAANRIGDRATRIFCVKVETPFPEIAKHVV